MPENLADRVSNPVMQNVVIQGQKYAVMEPTWVSLLGLKNLIGESLIRAVALQKTADGGDDAQTIQEILAILPDDPAVLNRHLAALSRIPEESLSQATYSEIEGVVGAIWSVLPREKMKAHFFGLMEHAGRMNGLAANTPPAS